MRPECPSCVSVGSRAESVQTIGIQMCGASDEHDVEFVGDGRGPPVQVRSGPLKLTNHHLHRTRQLVDHGATHSDTDNPSSLGRRQESPSHRGIAVPGEEHVRHGRCAQKVWWVKCARKCGWRQHARGGCKQSVGLEPVLNMRSSHSVQVYVVSRGHCCYLRGHTPE